MDDGTKAAARQTMKELLTALGIERVISIDDYNADLDEPLQLNDPTDVTAELLVADVLLEPIASILANTDPELEFNAVDSTDPLAVVTYLGENWGVLPRSVRHNLVQAAHTHRDGREARVADDELADDVRAPELLREFLQGAADLKQYSLAEWRSGASKDLDDPSPVLVLIDKNFTREAEAGGTGDTGEQLLAEVLESSGSHVHAGLLTREAQDGDGERDSTATLRKRFEANASRVLAIGKFRLTEPTQFPAAIRTLLLVAEITAYRRLAVEALNSAHLKVLEHFETLEDHSLVGAIAMAQKEGTFELEHPLRLAQRRYQQLLAHAVRTPEAAVLLPKLREGTVAKYINSGESGRQIRELQHADIFEPSSTFNDLGLPIEVGDIFERSWAPQGTSPEDSGRKSLYVLLAQACDLSIRGHGSRGSVVELVLHPFEVLDEEEFKRKPGKRKLYHRLGNLWQDDRVWGAKFTDSIVVPSHAVDATVFRTDGRALLDPAAPDTRPMAEGWGKRQDALLRWATKAINQYSAAEANLRGVPNSGQHLCRLAASYGMGSMEKSRGVSVRFDTAARTLEFGLQRVARIRSDVAVNVASLTMSYAARPAFEAASVTDSV